ncbi:MAG TPA: DUF4252 domain-containing protein [Candidatus Didemnitutus sp.]|nr:DUF4252 domain-containing protein [Candidatus Didemnitutus sp.]
MNTLIRYSLGAVAALALAGVVRAADVEPGFVDIGKLAPSSGGKFVEVNLSPSMLKFAARLVAIDEPDTASLIGNLKRIRVNVVGLDDSNRAGAIEKIENVRKSLEAQGWSQMVSVRENEGGDNVDIHVKQHGDDSIDGLVITVIDHKGEAVFVNIVGNINPDQLAKVAQKLDIEPLRKIHLKMEHAAKDKEA